MTQTTTTKPPEAPVLKRKDFVSNQEVRWCPGCGDYSILAQIQKMLPDIGVPREKIVFVSGIGCSSRFPYYMNTYGLHSIHGRAIPVATGIKSARPDLSVWVISGDGDALSIGGNHFLHALRRNVDLKVIVFNNRIYGLTKGQVSPTSEFGKRTKSTPDGSIERPVNAISFALASGATFIARSIDSETKHLQSVLRQAADHKGVAFVEVYQNCLIFNDGAFSSLTDKETKDDRLLFLEDGKPLVYGKNRDRGLRLNGYRLESVRLGDGVAESDLVVHDTAYEDTSLAYLLVRDNRPDLPVVMGVLRDVEHPTYDGLLSEKIEAAYAKKGKGALRDLIYTGQRWVVEPQTGRKS